MSSSKRLTQALLDSTRAAPGTEVWLSDDDGMRGTGRLAIRFNAKGNGLWYFRYSIKGKKVLLPLGRFLRSAEHGHLTLKDAREKARALSDLHCNLATRDMRTLLESHGSAHGAVAAQASAPHGDLTLLDVCNNYVESLKIRGRISHRQTACQFRVHVETTEWASKPANSVSPEDIADLIRPIIERGQGTTADHVRRALHAAYALAMTATADPRMPKSAARRTGITTNPVGATASLSGLSKARKRPALSRTELGHLWLELNDGPGKDLMQTCFIRVSILLGGQRCEQLLRCGPQSVDTDNNTLCLFDSKGRRNEPREHLLPLTPLALREVVKLRQLSSDLGSPHLFIGRSTKRPLHSSTIAHVMAAVSRRMQAAGRLAQPFLYANIRSTIETTLSSLGVPPNIRAQIQSHGISGVQAKHYDFWAYMPEKRDALLKWEAHILRCADEARKSAPAHDLAAAASK